MMMRKVILLTMLVFLAGFSRIQADVRLAGVFGDNMVIQRDHSVKVWGWADRNEPVKVIFQDQEHKTHANRNGAWSVTLQPLKAGGPYSLQVKGKRNMVEYQNILVGEVWLCSGQSNMVWPVSLSGNPQEEIAAADHSYIRELNVTKKVHWIPQADIEGQWKVCSPETVADFSALAYYYARELYRKLGVPIGIINSSWGATDIETWISAPTYENLPATVTNPYDPALIASLDKYLSDNSGNLDGYLETMSRDRGLDEKWFKENTDDAAWNQMELPQKWAETPLANVDGFVWFRYAVTLPASAEGVPASLSLGQIDDADITWINGVEVGRLNGYNHSRVYPVPAGVLKAGRNVITIRVEDELAMGGFMSSVEAFFLEIPGSETLKVSLAGSWKYFPTVVNADYFGTRLEPNSLYSLLYNAMINPLKDFRIRGAIWYQGESNTARAYAYRTLFPSLIQDWREQWGYEFPFYWVQLANYMEKEKEPANSAWAELREAQTMALSLPQTGQAVTIDIGEAYDIHPKNKQDAAKRLAFNAFHGAYGMKEVVFSGPTYSSMQKQGNKIVLTFDLYGSMLNIRSKYGYIEGFAIAGADQQFFWAKAELQGAKVVVWSDQVGDPVAVRFAWGNNPDVSLYNQVGLPVVPFRTDNWKGITEK